MSFRTSLLWLVTGTLVLVGSWPGSPALENRVAWRAEGPGLRFEPPSQCVGEAPLWIDTGAITLELWLDSRAPVQTGNREIFALIDGAGVHRLLVGRFREGLILGGHLDNPAGDPKRNLYGDLAPHTRIHHLAVTIASHGAALFANGATTGLALPATHAVPGLSFGGRLLLGTSDESWAEWRGSIFALAIHQGILTATEIAQHAGLRPDRSPDEFVTQLDGSPDLFALYLLDEGGGGRAESRIAGAPALLLPKRLTRPMRTTIFSGFEHQRWLPLDVTRNILGFMPFGFLVASGSWQRTRPSRSAVHRNGAGRGVWLALTYGLALSLAIELAQLWIPGRDSSCLDWIGNGTGALLGGSLAAGVQNLTRSAAQLEDDPGAPE